MTTSPAEPVTLNAVKFNGLKTTENVVFFGNDPPVECQRCGAFNQTGMGHKFCTHVSCPIALREFKRRMRKRTSSLEKVFIPQSQDAALRCRALHGTGVKDSLFWRCGR